MWSPLVLEQGHPLPGRRMATGFSWGQRGKNPPGGGGGIWVSLMLQENVLRGLPDLTRSQGAPMAQLLCTERLSAGKVQPQVLSHRQLFVPR